MIDCILLRILLQVTEAISQYIVIVFDSISVYFVMLIPFQIEKINYTLEESLNRVPPNILKMSLFKYIYEIVLNLSKDLVQNPVRSSIL